MFTTRHFGNKLFLTNLFWIKELLSPSRLQPLSQCWSLAGVLKDLLDSTLKRERNSVLSSENAPATNSIIDLKWWWFEKCMRTNYKHRMKARAMEKRKNYTRIKVPSADNNCQHFQRRFTSKTFRVSCCPRLRDFMSWRVSCWWVESRRFSLKWGINERF